MKENRKRVLSLLLVLVMLVGLFPSSAFADDVVQVQLTCNAPGAKVTVYEKNVNGEAYEVQCSGDGYYHILPGTYYYAAEADGYADQEMTPFTVTADAEQTVTVTMAAIEQPTDDRQTSVTNDVPQGSAAGNPAQGGDKSGGTAQDTGSEPKWKDTATVALDKDEDKQDRLKIVVTGGKYPDTDPAPYKLLEQDETLKQEYLAKLAEQLDDESVMVREIIDCLSLVVVENNKGEKPATLRQPPKDPEDPNSEREPVKLDVSGKLLERFDAPLFAVWTNNRFDLIEAQRDEKGVWHFEAPELGLLMVVDLSDAQPRTVSATVNDFTVVVSGVRKGAQLTAQAIPEETITAAMAPLFPADENADPAEPAFLAPMALMLSAEGLLENTSVKVTVSGEALKALGEDAVLYKIINDEAVQVDAILDNGLGSVTFETAEMGSYVLAEPVVKADAEAEAMPAQTFEGETDGVHVAVTAPVGAFPKGTVMVVTPVFDEAVLEAIEDAVEDRVTSVQAVDITFYSDGAVIEPAKPINVVLTSDMIAEAEQASVVHLDNEGETQILEETVQEENSISFDAGAFSVYAIVDSTSVTVDYVTAEGETYNITVECPPEAKIPEGAELSVSEFMPDSPEYMSYYYSALEALKIENPEKPLPARIFDISIFYNGEEIEPKAPVAVRASLAYATGLEQRVVHFDADGPVVMEAEQTESGEVCFETESFSVYGVIATTPPQSVDDLDGWTFTLDRGGRYVTPTALYNNSPFGLEKSQNESDSAVWTFEKSGGAYGYTFYNISTTVNGEKRYLHMWPAGTYAEAGAHTTLQPTDNQQAVEQGCPQNFAVIKNDDNTYSIFIVLNGTWFYLNEWGNEGGNRFAGWHENNNGSHFNITFLSKDGQQPVEDGKEYAIVIHHTDDEYYVVENDGTLTKLDKNSITFNKDGSVKRVKMDNPIFWKYDYIRYGNHNIWHNTEARVLDEGGTNLPINYYRRYLTVDRAKGYDDLPDDINPWTVDNSSQYLNVNYNDDHTLNHYDRYLGVEQDSDGTLRIKGQCAETDAAEVYFAEVENVDNLGEVSAWYHTVNHIDIAISAQAGIDVPLAYGNYTLGKLSNEDLANIDNLTDDEIIERATDKQPLVVAHGQNDDPVPCNRSVPITQDDIRKANLAAYTEYTGERKYLDDVYLVTGYSGNSEAGEGDLRTEQVRLEGVFKVSDLAPIPTSYAATENEANDKNYVENGTDTGKTIKQVRLERPIYYTVDITKPVTFTLTYDLGGTTYVILKDDGTPLRLTVDVNLTSSFSYWDQPNEDGKGGNECPGINLWTYGKEKWQQGAIYSNYNYSPGSPINYGPGMDFRLGAPLDDSRHDIVAIEVTKYVQGIYGANDIRTLTLKEGTDCLVNVYQNNSTVKLHDKPLTVSTNGIGMFYDYDVKAGTYENPAYAQISEVPSSVADTIIDADGTEWVYDHTRIETEFAYRHDGKDNPSRYISKDYTKQDTEFLSESEVIGEYTVPDGTPYEYEGAQHDGVHEYNRFLEFYIYNVYKRKDGDLKIIKNLSNYEHSEGETDYEPAAFVFLVEGELDGKPVYSNSATITLSTSGEDYALMQNIPDGATVTVTEVYAGAHYEQLGGTPTTQTITINVAETKVAEVTFKNNYKPEDNDGGGLNNTAKQNGDNVWEFVSNTAGSDAS